MTEQDKRAEQFKQIGRDFDKWFKRNERNLIPQCHSLYEAMLEAFRAGTTNGIEKPLS